MNLKWRRRRVWGRMKRTKWPFVTKTLIERVLLFLSLSLSTHTHTHTNKRRRLLADLGPFRDTVQRLQRVSMESERHISLRGKGAKKKKTHTHTQTNKQTNKQKSANESSPATTWVCRFLFIVSNNNDNNNSSKDLKMATPSLPKMATSGSAFGAFLFENRKSMINKTPLKDHWISYIYFSRAVLTWVAWILWKQPIKSEWSDWVDATNQVPVWWNPIWIDSLHHVTFDCLVEFIQLGFIGCNRVYRVSPTHLQWNEIGLDWSWL